MVTIYGLRCPIDGMIKYIGKTKKPKLRYMQHLRNETTGSVLKRKWISILKEQGLKPIWVKMEEVTFGGVKQEAYYINKHKSTVFNVSMINGLINKSKEKIKPNPENKISLKQFSDESGLRPDEVTRLTTKQKYIKTVRIGGRKFIDRTKFPPKDYSRES